MSKNRKELWNNSAQGAGKQIQLKHEEVACVAYELFEQRGRQDGRDQEDWFKAEALVKERRSS